MPPPEQQRQARREERAREEPRSGSEPPPQQQQAAGETAVKAATGKKQRQSGMGLEAAVVTAGKDGACNIRVEWISVSLPYALTCRFAVTTGAGNSLEASMEQKSYRRSYQGTSSLQTDLTPVAPIGTRGKLTVRDLTTGETLEQPWIWRIGAGGSTGLWELLKKLFT